jgi:prevent-host-death family protein
MKTYTYSQARQNLSAVLNRARTEDVYIRRRGGETFKIASEQAEGSPFDVRGIKTKAKTADILDAIKETRQRAR